MAYLSERLASLRQEVTQSRDLNARDSEKTEHSPSETTRGWCREGELNPQGTKYRRILSPLRLPVPPSRLAGGIHRLA